MIGMMYEYKYEYNGESLSTFIDNYNAEFDWN